jgi:aminopeptidase N
MDTLLASIGEFTESLPAALCWAAAWDMCRDGELAARDYVRLVMTGITSITNLSVAQTLLRQANMVLRRYTDPAWRETGLGFAADSLRGLLDHAEPGSDFQLTYVDAFASVAISPADLALLAGLLDGTAAVEGLSVDTELRWHLLQRLVSRGVAGEPEIAAELARDATDAGERQAATCRAAIPTAAAKQAAWDQIISGTLPNAMFRAVLAGFADPDQLALLAPYEQRYFEAVPRAWRDWSSDMARWFVSYAYPIADDPSVIAATSDLIARTDQAPGLVRLLVEGRDGLRRALRCQERDRQASTRPA